MVDIVTALGAGSGVDYTSLVTELVDAQFAGQTTALTTKNTTLTTQISTIASVQSGISSFSTALTSLVKGGTLTTQPTSSNTSVLNVTALAGAKLAGYSSTVEVQQLASAQSVATPPIADRTAAIGTGSFSLVLGTGDITSSSFAPSGTAFTIPITSADSSLDGIAAAINAAHTTVTASVVTDSDGARLTLKGKSGAAQAFTLTATEDAADPDTTPALPGLATLNVGGSATGTTIGTRAQDAIVAVDGVALKRSTNSISDLIPGIKLDLVNAAVGTTVSIGTSSPSSSIIQAVSDFVESYNQFLTVTTAATDAATGSLHNDVPTKSLVNSLAQLTLTQLSTGAATGAPTRLADIGVSTNRDGTLSVDSSRLITAFSQFPDAVEAMFADGTGASGAGLGAALAAITTAATSSVYGLASSTATYTKAQATVADDQTALTTQEDTVRTRLTAQFATTQTRVTAYKATQAYLTQQIAAWNASSDD